MWQSSHEQIEERRHAHHTHSLTTGRPPAPALPHFVHHARGKEGVNFNILPLSIGDWLRGKKADATPEEIAEARALGLID